MARNNHFNLLKTLFLLAIPCLAIAIAAISTQNTYAIGAAGPGSQYNPGSAEGGGTDCNAPNTPALLQSCAGASFRLYKFDPDKEPFVDGAPYGHVNETYAGNELQIWTDFTTIQRNGTVSIDLSSCQDAGWYIRYGYEATPGSTNYGTAYYSQGHQIGIGEVKSSHSNYFSSTKIGGSVFYNENNYADISRMRKTSAAGNLSLDPTRINWEELDGAKLLWDDAVVLFNAMPDDYKNGFTTIDSHNEAGQGLGWFCFSPEKLQNDTTFQSQSGVNTVTSSGWIWTDIADGSNRNTEYTIGSSDPSEQTVSFSQRLYVYLGQAEADTTSSDTDYTEDSDMSSCDSSADYLPAYRPKTLYSADANCASVPERDPPATTQYRIRTTVITDNVQTSSTVAYGIADPSHYNMATAASEGWSTATTAFTGNDDAHSWSLQANFQWLYFLDNAQTVSIPSGEDGQEHRVKICQKIEYLTTSIKYENVDGTVTTTPTEVSADSPHNTFACATIIREAQISNPNTPAAFNGECGIGGNATATINYGNTTGFTGVQNMTSNSGWRNTVNTYNSSSNNSQTIYAKPGDSIQFQHCITFGASAVRGGANSHGVDSHRLASRENSIPYVGRNWMGIELTTTYLGAITGEPKYLFNNANQFRYPDSTYYYTAGNLRGSALPSRFANYAAWTNNYVALIQSPSTNGYSCASTNIAWQSPGYQVHGLSVGSPNYYNCAAANTNTGVAVSDVGKTITQTLHWNYAEAWVNRNNTDSGGSCGCGTDTTTDTNEDIESYVDALSATNIGDLNYHCHTGSCCEYSRTGRCRKRWHSGPYSTWTYPVSYATHDAVDKSATVIIPYNFTTSVASWASDADKGALAGETVETNIQVTVDKRLNEEVSPTEYATIMPEKSKIQIVEFIIDDSVTYNNADSKLNENYMRDQSNSSNVCAYFQSVVNITSNCNIVDSINRDDISTRGFNNDGNLDGETAGTGFSRLITTTTPDIEVGQKYCVAVGVYPADSHNIIAGLNATSNNVPRGNSSPGSNGGHNGVDETGDYWHISRASCRSVTKEPSFQAWNGDIRTPSAHTTITAKAVGNGFSGSANGDQVNSAYRYGQPNHFAFGSWGENNVLFTTNLASNYYLVSGAAVGYQTVDGQLSQALNPQGGKLTSNVTSSSELSTHLCDYAPLTIPNSPVCSSASGNGTLSVSSSNIISQLRSRYVVPIIEKDNPESNINNINSHVITTGNTSTTNGVNSNNQKTYYYLYSEGDVTLNIDNLDINNPTFKKADSTSQADPTYIIYSTGTVTITSNLCYEGNSSCFSPDNGTAKPSLTASSDARPGFNGSNFYTNNYVNKLLSNSATTYSAIDQLPQTIIFAKDIKIAPQVTQIDAWLIAVGSDISGDFREATGTIDTCSTFANQTTEADNTVSTRSSVSYTGGSCANQLVVNGPTFAGTLLLHRTAGAYPGSGSTEGDGKNPTQQNVMNDGSVTPAEIFNFRADTYLWAYGQAQDTRQAETTYTRELPPRY